MPTVGGAKPPAPRAEAAARRLPRGVASCCHRRSRVCPPPRVVRRRESVPTAPGRLPGDGRGDRSPSSRRTLSDVRVAVTGSHGLIGTALVRAPPRRRPRAGAGRPVDARRPARSAGTRTPDGSTRRRSPASTPSSTWPAPASATSAGPTSTSAWSSSRGRAPRRCSPRRWPRREGGPRVLLSGSAVGFYGDRGDEELDERSPAGTGFLADVAEAWEASTAAAERAGRAGRAPAHRHRAGPEGRGAGQDAAAVQGRPRRPLRVGQAVDELDHASTTRSARSSTC